MDETIDKNDVQDKLISCYLSSKVLTDESDSTLVVQTYYDGKKIASIYTGSNVYDVRLPKLSLSDITLLNDFTIPEGKSFGLLSNTTIAAGTNLKRMFISAFNGDNTPIITLPYIKVDKYFPDEAVVGSQFTTKVNVKFNSGNYEYGPDTGVKLSALRFEDTEGYLSVISNVDGILDRTYELSTYTVTPNMQFTLSVTGEYTDASCVANTQMHVPTELSISAGETDTSCFTLSAKPVELPKCYVGATNVEEYGDNPTSIPTDDIKAFSVVTDFNDVTYEQPIAINKGSYSFYFAAPIDKYQYAESITMTKDNKDTTIRKIFTREIDGYAYKVWYNPGSIATTKDSQITKITVNE